MSAANAATAAARPPPSPADRKPPLPEFDLFEVRETPAGRSLIARQDIEPGAWLFGEDAFADAAERASFTTLSAAELGALAPERRAGVLRFGHNTAPDQITGTFHAEAVRHPTNFLNHSCDPNAGYDGADAIVALRPIAAGEEIRMDYGTFSFSFDHEFACRCGAPACRGRVTSRSQRDALDAHPRWRQRRRLERRVVARDAAREAHPQPAALVEREGIGGRGVEEEAAQGGAQPQAAGGILADREHRARVEAALRADAGERERRRTTLAPPRADQPAATGAHPESAVLRRGEPVEVLARQPLLVSPPAHARRRAAVVAEGRQAATAAGEPERAVAALRDRLHLARGDREST